MLYIKLDNNGNPINHPLTGDNLKYVLEESILTEDVLKKYGYAKFEFTPLPANAVSQALPEYFIDIDGIVRNRITTREFTHEELIDKFIRSRRSYLLVESDWTQTIDSPLSAEKKAEWAAYRQALRDLPNLYLNTQIQQQSDIEWPTKPS